MWFTRDRAISQRHSRRLHEAIRQRYTLDVTRECHWVVAGEYHWEVAGSRPFFVMAGTAAGDDRNSMSALAASGSLAPTATPAENTEIF